MGQHLDIDCQGATYIVTILRVSYSTDLQEDVALM